jgi:hypothetical protein
MLGITFASVLETIKAEAGISLSTGTQSDDAFCVQIANKQESFGDSFFWPHLEVFVDKAVGGRYTTLPALNRLHRIQAWVLDGSSWLDLGYGVGPDEWNVYDVATTSTPIQRWRITADNQVEYWPTPSQATTVRFQGQLATVYANKKSTANVLFLDDLLVAYSVAADWLARQKKQDAGIMLKRADQRLFDLRGNAGTKHQSFRIGSKTEESQVLIRQIKPAP